MFNRGGVCNQGGKLSGFWTAEVTRCKYRSTGAGLVKK